MKSEYFKTGKGLFIFITALFFIHTGLKAQTYTFTACGNTGSVGPTQGQLTGAYFATNLSLVVSTTPISGIQTWTVPASGLYGIDTYGASGGSPANYPTKFGGFGARIKGEFNLVIGDVLRILVGQKGGNGTGGSGGGGGTYVTRNNVIIIAAGAGGGGTSDNSAADASILTSGTNDFPGGTIQGGTNGNGGQTCNLASGGANHGGAGGGYLTDGATSTAPTPGGGGSCFLNGGTGGVGGTAGAWGGFGGGGGATQTTVGGGGGGGYSGGAGGQQVNYCTPGIMRSGGGGGGSYNSGTNQVNSVLTAAADGKVIIESLCSISLTTPVNPICIGSTIVLSTDAASGISWSSSASTASSISISPTVTTSYSVIGTSTANCVAGTLITVTVNPLPVVTAVVTPTTLCKGNTATISATGANTYTWSSGNSGPATSTVNPLVNTIYTVTATSAQNCVNTKTVSVNVNTNTLTVIPNTNLCIGSSMSLSASGAITYTWSNGILFQTVPVSPTITTTYTVGGTDVYNCVLNNSVVVTVLSLPPVLASADKPLACKGDAVTLTASGASTYTWNTGYIGSSVTYTLPIDINYYYSVAGSDAGGCTKTVSITVSVAKCLGINEVNTSSANVNILPNPGNGLFNLIVDNVSDHLSIKVYNELGMLIKTQRVISEESTLDIQNEKAGIYFVRVCDYDNVMKVIKLIKE